MWGLLRLAPITATHDVNFSNTLIIRKCHEVNYSALPIMHSSLHVHMRKLIKPGSQYDTGVASITSIVSVMRKRYFFTSQTLSLMSNFQQSDWMDAS